MVHTRFLDSPVLNGHESLVARLLQPERGRQRRRDGQNSALHICKRHEFYVFLYEIQFLKLYLRQG
jgi:hypothetical protein